MILQKTKNNRTFQAYKEIGITRNVIIEVFELIKFKTPFGYEVTNHKFILSKGTNLNFNETNENNANLIYEAEKLLSEVKE